MSKRVKKHLRESLIMNLLMFSVVVGLSCAWSMPIFLFVYPWLAFGAMLWDWPTEDVKEKVNAPSV